MEKEKISASELKKSAKILLRGNWRKGAIINLVAYAMIIIFQNFFEIFDFLAINSYDNSNVAILFSIIGIIFFMISAYPFYWRNKCFFELNNSNRRLEFINPIRFSKRNFWHAIKFYFLFNIYIMAHFLILFIAFLILYKIFHDQLIVYIGTVSQLLFFVALLFFIACIYNILNYSVAIFVLLENPGITVREALKRSKVLMKGYKLKYLWIFYISFFGWIILSILTFGIGFLFVSSYITVADCEFYRELKRIKNFKVDSDENYKEKYEENYEEYYEKKNEREREDRNVDVIIFEENEQNM